MAAGSLSPGATQLVSELQLDINRVDSEGDARNIGPRKASAKKLLSSVFADQVSVELRRELMDGPLRKPLLRGITGHGDSVREVCYSILSRYASEASPESLGALMEFLLPVLAARFGSGRVLEDQEEIRVLSVKLLTGILPRVAEPARFLGDDLVRLLKQHLADSFEEVLIAACALLETLCATVNVRFCGEPLVRALVPVMAHKLSKVRLPAVQTMRALLVGMEPTPFDLIKELTPHFALRVLDETQKVRVATVSVVGELLCVLTDRRSMMRLLLPVLLVGARDDFPETQLAASAALDALGAQVEAAERDELRDTFEYGADEVLDRSLLSAPLAARPRLGARVLIGTALHDVTPPVLASIADWTVKQRVVAVGVLEVLLAYSERKLVYKLEEILRACEGAVADDEPAVRSTVSRLLTAMGSMLDPAVYLVILLPRAKGAVPLSTNAIRVGALRVLAALLRGSGRRLALPADALLGLEPAIAALTDPHAFDSPEPALRAGVLDAVAALVEVALTPAALKEALLPLTRALLLQLMYRGSEGQGETIRRLLGKLASSTDQGSVHSLTALLVQPMVTELTAGMAPGSVWGSGAPELRLLEVLCAEAAGPALAASEQPALLALLASLLGSPEPEVRTRAGNVVTLLVRAAGATAADPPAHAAAIASPLTLRSLFHGPLTEGLVWRAGVPAGDARHAAAEALLAIAELCAVDALLSGDGLDLSQLAGRLATVLDDRFEATRLVVVRLVAALWQAQLRLGTTTAVPASLLADVIKRLDDSLDAIRIAAAAALETHCAALTGAEEGATAAALAATLLVHADDASTAVQAAVMAPLRLLAAKFPGAVTAAAEAARAKHRSERNCVELLRIASAAQ